nr:quinonprotein alcohol dehydrogenase [Sunxiuqinia sp.]
MNGLSESENVPIRWSETENVAWKIPVRGLGWSSPVVYDNQIWLTSADKDGQWFSAVCLDFETGEILMEKELFKPETVQRIHGINRYA